VSIYRWSMLSIVHSPCCRRAVSLCLRLESLLSRQAFLYLYALYRAPFVVEGIFAFAQLQQYPWTNWTNLILESTCIIAQLRKCISGIHEQAERTWSWNPHVLLRNYANAFEFFAACSNNLTLDYNIRKAVQRTNIQKFRRLQRYSGARSGSPQPKNIGQECTFSYCLEPGGYCGWKRVNITLKNNCCCCCSSYQHQKDLHLCTSST